MEKDEEIVLCEKANKFDDCVECYHSVPHVHNGEYCSGGVCLDAEITKCSPYTDKLEKLKDVFVICDNAKNGNCQETYCKMNSRVRLYEVYNQGCPIHEEFGLIPFDQKKTLPETELNKPTETSLFERQARYTGKDGVDYIERCENTFTTEEMRGAYKFTIGKYVERYGKKYDVLKEAYKILDYAKRLYEFEKRLADGRSQ